jgi:IS30 family transposase
MTYKKLPADKDRRRKLTEQAREEIQQRHINGESMNSLSKLFNVSRATIGNVLHPERTKNRNPQAGYGKEKSAESRKKTIEYRREVFYNASK